MAACGFSSPLHVGRCYGAGSNSECAELGSAASLRSEPDGCESNGFPQTLARQGEQGLCMDVGYAYDEVRRVAQEFGYTTHIRSRGQETQAKIEGHKGGAQSKTLGDRAHAQLA